MRIGMIAWSFYPRVGGGVTSTVQLARSLIKKGVDVEIIAPSIDKEGLHFEDGLKVHRVKGIISSNYTANVSRVPFLYYLNKRVSQLAGYFDMLHAQDFNIGTLSAVIRKKKPVVSIFAADPIFEFINYSRKNAISYNDILRSNSLKIRMCRKLINKMCSKIDRIISVSPSLNKIIERYSSRSEIVNIPYGIEISKFQNSVNELKLKKRSKHILLVVARFVCWKNIDGAVRIYNKIKEKIKEVEMVVIGEGPLTGYYRRKFSNLKGVRILTGIPYEEIIDYYKNASIFLFPTYYETFGIVTLEAMAAKIPILASDLEVVRDRVIDGITGFLADPNDEEMFAKKAVDILTEKVPIKRIVDNAFTLVKSYDINIIADRYIDLYKKLA